MSLSMLTCQNEHSAVKQMYSKQNSENKRRQTYRVLCPAYIYKIVSDQSEIINWKLIIAHMNKKLN